MFKIKSMFAAAVIASLIAAPVSALVLSADAMLGASPEDMTTVKMIEDSAFVGNEVMTKDQIVIGLVEGVLDGGANGSFALIALKSDLASKSTVKTFTVPLMADMTADGSLTLNFTEAELFLALDGGLEPMTTN